MKKGLKVFGGVVALLVVAVTLAYAMGENSEKTYTWRYKTTVTVDTPEGEKSGSAVREVNVTIKACPVHICEKGYLPGKVSTKGEAVAVDLGQRGMLFSIIPTDSYLIVFNIFPGPHGGLTPEGAEYYSQLKNAKAEMGHNGYIMGQIPTMVTFEDINDPKTVQLAYSVAAISVPNQAAWDFKTTDNLEKLFGKGVHLKNVTVEMTDEPVTWGIEKILQWLGKVKMSYLNGKHINGPKLYDQLHGGNFQIGE
ncbi:MAG: hypothetical protein PHX61_06860 [Alphaproteobacteria bacterium]|nr:hypothetical protein [Alphaproteobacteria bacterium]